MKLYSWLDDTGEALCDSQARRHGGFGRLRAGKEFVLLTAMQAVACNLSDR